jgi:hypothetical protein
MKIGTFCREYRYRYSAKIMDIRLSTATVVYGIRHLEKNYDQGPDPGAQKAKVPFQNV